MKLNDSLLKMYREGSDEEKAELRKMAHGNEALTKALDECDGGIKKALEIPEDALTALLKGLEVKPETPVVSNVLDGTQLDKGFQDLEGVDPDEDTAGGMDPMPVFENINKALALLGGDTALSRKGTVALAKRLDFVSKALVTSNGQLAAENAALKSQIDGLQKSIDGIGARLGMPVAPRGVTTQPSQIVAAPSDAGAQTMAAPDAETRVEKAMHAAHHMGDESRVQMFARLLPLAKSMTETQLQQYGC